MRDRFPPKQESPLERGESGFSSAQRHHDARGSRLLAWLILAALFLATSMQRGNAQEAPWHAQIIARWDSYRPILEQEIRNRMTAGDPYVLYDLQLRTDNLERYADLNADAGLSHQLSSVYLIPLQYLDPQEHCWKCGPTHRHTTLRNQEVVLVSAQYLYILARHLRHLVSHPIDVSTSPDRAFIAAVPPVLSSHLRRWVLGSGAQKAFSVRGWGCSDKNLYNHNDFVRRKAARALGTEHSYCNAITDTDVWIICATVEFLAAHRKAPNLVPLPESTATTLSGYVHEATEAIRSRFQYGTAKDFSHRDRRVIHFDLGAWDDHPDYRSSGGKNVGWDISHGRRFVQAMLSLSENRLVTGSTFPTDEDLRCFANLLCYVAFNRDFEHPLFTNFLDGTNGRYRQYGPYELSESVPTGGYGFLQEKTSDLARLMRSVLAATNASTPSRTAWCASYYPMSVRDRTLFLLMFLPSIAPREQPRQSCAPGVSRGHPRLFESSSQLVLKEFKIPSQTLQHYSPSNIHRLLIETQRCEQIGDEVGSPHKRAPQAYSRQYAEEHRRGGRRDG